jgi:hypothetical protein
MLKISPTSRLYQVTLDPSALGIPVADLQGAAGHESVDTTRRYDRSRFDPERHPSFLMPPT